MDSQILTARQVYTQTATYRYSQTGLHTDSHTKTEQDWFTHRTAGPASIGHPSASWFIVPCSVGQVWPGLW